MRLLLKYNTWTSTCLHWFSERIFKFKRFGASSFISWKFTNVKNLKYVYTMNEGSILAISTKWSYHPIFKNYYISTANITTFTLLFYTEPRSLLKYLNLFLFIYLYLGGVSILSNKCNLSNNKNRINKNRVKTIFVLRVALTVGMKQNYFCSALV